MEYRWKQYEPVNILNMELAEFDLTKTEYSIKDVEYVAGMHWLMQKAGLFLPHLAKTVVNFSSTKWVCQLIAQGEGGWGGGGGAFSEGLAAVRPCVPQKRYQFREHSLFRSSWSFLIHAINMKGTYNYLAPLLKLGLSSPPWPPPPHPDQYGADRYKICTDASCTRAVKT